jgi:hypothetical protein
VGKIDGGQSFYGHDAALGCSPDFTAPTIREFDSSDGGELGGWLREKDGRRAGSKYGAAEVGGPSGRPEGSYPQVEADFNRFPELTDCARSSASSLLARGKRGRSTEPRTLRLRCGATSPAGEKPGKRAEQRSCKQSACGELRPHGSEHESLPRGALLSARKEAEPQGKSKWAELAPGGPIRVLLIFLFYISYFFLFLLNLKFEFDSYYEVQL